MTEQNPPAPLVPADVDLSRLDGFMLDTVRLLGSELVALSTGDEFKAAVLLWCRSWKQRPACSLPDDDRVLASFAGYGGDLKRWRKVKAMALRGFIACSDGRLYHQVLAQDALRAHKARQQRIDAINKRWGKEGGSDDRPEPPPAPTTLPTGDTTKMNTATYTAHDTPVSTAVRSPVIPSDARDGTGRDGTERKKTFPTASDAARAIAAAFLELREQHWPGDSRQPAPRMTIEAEAEQFIAAGATPELAREIIDRVMRTNLAKGDGPPNSLKFCRLTLERAARQHSEAASGSIANGNGHASADTPPHRVLLWQGRLATWLESGTWDKGWSILDCPTAVVNEYRDRLRAKPPPGTSVTREMPDGEAA